MKKPSTARFIVIVMGALCLEAMPGLSQPFTDFNVNFGFNFSYGGGYAPSSVAGDFNADGKMDLAFEGLSSYGLDPIWLNNGDGTVTDLQNLNGLENGLAGGTCAAADFFNLGRIDVLFTGSPNNGGPSTQLWQNSGSNVFTLVANSGLLPSRFANTIAVGDFNNDGKLDIVLTGVNFNSTSACLARNLGNGNFTNVVSGLQASGSVFAGDFDNDGYLDLFIGASLWRNLGNGTFTNVNSGVPGSVLAVADFDHNGTLDVVVNNGNYQIWYNTGNGTFTNSNISLPAVSGSSAFFPPGAAAGDYDNDGLTDVLLTCGSFQQFSTSIQVWRNRGDGTFTNAQTLTDVNGPFQSLMTWFDFTQDSRLDFLTVLQDGADNHGSAIYHPHIWQNVSGCASNAPPTAPTNLTARVMGNGVKMLWGAATDDHTPASGLNYNIRVGSSSGGVDIVSPEADPVTGQRRVVDLGNAQERLFSLLTNLSGGTYYWSVQAIDTAFAGGAFATEASFVIPPAIGSFAFGTNGQFQTSFSALAGSSYTLQASTNLLTWTNLTTLVPTNTGAVQLMDTNAGIFVRRYYRVKIP